MASSQGHFLILEMIYALFPFLRFMSFIKWSYALVYKVASSFYLHSPYLQKGSIFIILTTYASGYYC